MNYVFASKLFMALLAIFAAFTARKKIYSLLQEAEGLVYKSPHRALELCGLVDEFSDEELILSGCHDWLHGVRAAAQAMI